ncbi:hypothetical protein JXB31_01005 [Candidatus Woesearchaeota archaeon]|nr:hypothetical protein [Candidatus Woesearchaeota archaeon]
MTSNVKVSKEKGVAEISINPKLYPIDVIYSAAYVFLDKAYVLLKGDPESKVIAELKPKDKNAGLETIGNEFNSELLNYANYNKISEKNLEIKKLLLHEIFSHAIKSDEMPEETDLNMEIEDPDGILVPWEEKYGKEKNK